MSALTVHMESHLSASTEATWFPLHCRDLLPSFKHLKPWFISFSCKLRWHSLFLHHLVPGIRLTPGRARKYNREESKTTDHYTDLGSLPKWTTKKQGQNYFKLEQNQAQLRAFKHKSTAPTATWETRTPAAHFYQHCFDCRFLWPLPSVKFTRITSEAVTEAPVYK